MPVAELGPCNKDHLADTRDGHLYDDQEADPLLTPNLDFQPPELITEFPVFNSWLPRRKTQNPDFFREL